jgi:hypothetical protein
MRTHFRGAQAHSYLLAACFLCLVALPASSAPAPKLPPPEKDTPKTVHLDFEKATWKQVLAWLTEETGKPLITNYVPPGTFTFHGPADKKYTIPEVVDILNDTLMGEGTTQPFELVNRQRTFTLIPADERGEGRIWRVPVEGLAECGKHQYVSVIYPLWHLDADEFAPWVRLAMGDDGEVIPIKTQWSNRLILSARAGKLREICKWIGEREIYELRVAPTDYEMLAK